MISSNQVVTRNSKTASRVIAGEAIVLTPADSKIRTLNPTGSRIWELLGGKPTVAEIVDRIHREFDVTRDEAESDVRAFLDDLAAKGLVSVEPAKSAKE